jgi:hypothetical protein
VGWYYRKILLFCLPQHTKSYVEIPWNGITVGSHSVFLWLNIDQATTVKLFCLQQTLTSFTVEPFNIYFEDLM